MFDLVSFCQDYAVDYSTEGKNVSPGWMNISCPFCSDTSNHLGFSLNNSYFNCWKCGHKTIEQVIAELLGNISSDAIQSIVKSYKTRDIHVSTNTKKNNVDGNITYPIGTKPLTDNHKSYLESRNFEPQILENIYKLLGTGPVGDYKFRIITPIYNDNQLVSYIGRDITGQSKLRYKACASEKEVISHKDCLYGLDRVLSRGLDSIIIVEGITDVWRLGLGSVATFGIQFSIKQITQLKNFKRRFVLYDSESQAQKQALKLGRYLSGFGGETIILDTKQPGLDPGSMGRDDAKNVMKDLNIKI